MTAITNRRRMCAKGMLSPAAIQIRMLARHDAVPIGRSAVLRSRLRVSRLIEHGRISAGWAKEIGTSIPIGRLITERMPDLRQCSTVDLRRVDTAFTATRSNKGVSEMCHLVANQ